MRILIAGVPGSGKSTQAKMLAKALGLTFLPTGDLLRELAKEDSELGRQIKKSLDEGTYFDDSFIAELIKNRLKGDEYKRGFVSDSYPRHLPQIKHFDPNIEKIIYLDISQQSALKRLLARNRMDDNEELVKHRQQVYLENIQGLLGYYKDKIEIAHVNGEGNPEEVHMRILEVIKQ